MGGFGHWRENHASFTRGWMWGWFEQCCVDRCERYYYFFKWAGQLLLDHGTCCSRRPSLPSCPELAGDLKTPLCLKSLSPCVWSQAVRSGLKITLLWKSTSRKSQLFLWSPFPHRRQLFINLGNIKELLLTDLTSSSCCSNMSKGEDKYTPRSRT